MSLHYIPHLDHVRQKGLVIDDQPLLRRLLREPQATRIDLGDLERLRAVNGTYSAKVCYGLFSTYNMRLPLARMSMA